MTPQTLPDLARHMQLAVGPVVLISGVGLILLTMTNRFGRIIDRGPRVADLLEDAALPERRDALRSQLVILRRQAALMRVAVSLIVLSILLVATLILAMFVLPQLGVPILAAVEVLFVAALLAMVVGMAVFLGEITMSTAAHDLDLKRETDQWRVPAAR